MIAHNNTPGLPAYQRVVERLAAFNLSLSVSEIHGLICGYLCTGAAGEGEGYLRSLLTAEASAASREAQRCLFELFTLSQQQMQSGDFAFYMLLPEEHISLVERAQAFSEWCEGFSQAVASSAQAASDLDEPDAQDALRHIAEFARLDYAALSAGEDEEKALMEVSEYTRMAVLRLHHDWQLLQTEQAQETH
ncbi:MAG: UPF0149 family protein [Legionellaceae bacterium]|nr:UPF0149 family protein [Legionellaceae bacterium]